MADNNIQITRARSATDIATLIGLFGAFAFVVSAIFSGGSPGSFVNIPSIMIVIGGTVCITMMCFSMQETMHTIKVLMKTISHTNRDASEAAIQVLQIAELARRQGVLSLQAILSQLEDEPLLFKGVSMVVDGTPGEEVEGILKREMMSTVQRHHKSASVLKKAAEFAPAMGLIGTLIGLVQMLGNLEDPTTIGPAMAVALLTTFYGAVLANMVFSPLSSKLERNSNEEAVVNNIYVMGAASIGRQENPRRLEMMLNSVLPPAKRIQYFD